MLDKHGEKKPCKWGCGQAFKPAGKTQHEKFCFDNPKHADVAKRHRARFQSSKAAPLKVKFPTEKQEREETYTASYAPRAGVEAIYESFQDDPTMFSILCHLMSAHAGHDVMHNLNAARMMVELRIKNQIQNMED